MKKIGIITITDYTNYGNRLQNYATQEVLRKMGYSVESIKNSQISSNKSIKNFIRKTKVKGLKESLYAVKRRLQEKKTKSFYNERELKFREFSKNYISETDFYITIDSIPKDLDSKYDFFITGSDQVWNPIYRNESPIDFLQFASIEKRIAFSPSFGVSEIPERNKKNYSKWINEMKSISIREEAGEKIIKDLTGRSSEVLVDPTLLLSREEWLSISTETSIKPKQKFFLTYFLGEMSQTIKKEMEQFGSDNNLIMINLNDVGNKESFMVDPSEFIGLINSATAIFTDSFHGTVFSIIMNKPFIVYDRVENGESKMSSRIDTLLKKFKMENYHYKKTDDLNKALIQDTKYQRVLEILNLEKEKAINYLERSLSN